MRFSSHGNRKEERGGSTAPIYHRERTENSQILDLNLQFRMLRCLFGRLLSMFHSPFSPLGSETSRLGRKAGSLLSHLPTLAWGWFIKDVTRHAASPNPEGKRQTGCLGVVPSYLGVLVPKPASSARTEVGFNNTDSRVLSQPFWWVGLVCTRKLKISQMRTGAAALLRLLELQCTINVYLCILL